MMISQVSGYFFLAKTSPDHEKWHVATGLCFRKTPAAAFCRKILTSSHLFRPHRLWIATMPATINVRPDGVGVITMDSPPVNLEKKESIGSIG